MNDFEPLQSLAGVTTEALAALCRRCSVKKLDLFGSAATGRFDRARSDLDFLVTFDAASHRNYADAYFSLREGLEALSGRSVDLITEASLENPYFRARVESERVPVFEA